ncbi:MAG TPA: GNAT family N-acetyltransferase [Candidatus Angelobacter sp.]|nr:GNAT family N-acetyltransferase [Candidatus Angelobacter sp.]
MTADPLVLRNCTALNEFDQCVALQKEVWGFSDAELVPLRIFSLAPKIGGQVVGAWEGETLVGYAMAIPGNRHGHPYLHSHMVAVKESHRNTGVGRKLKLFQRNDAMARGYELMEWTFDPLEIKNSYFNLERLGAIARRYNVNQYGVTNSPLQGFLPTDRLVAEWWMNSRRVNALLTTGRYPTVGVEERVAVPHQIYDWKADPENRAKAEGVQARNRYLLQTAFALGLCCLGYERDDEGNGRFQLGFWDENLSYATKT